MSLALLDFLIQEIFGESSFVNAIMGFLTWDNLASLEDFDFSNSQEESIGVKLVLCDLFVRKTVVVSNE